LSFSSDFGDVQRQPQNHLVVIWLTCHDLGLFSMDCSGGRGGVVYHRLIPEFGGTEYICEGIGDKANVLNTIWLHPI